MKGINFIVNEEGEKQSVIIDLKEYGKLWEEFLDILTAESRLDEEEIDIDVLESRLKKQGKLSG